MVENRISATLSQADVDAIIAAINTIKQKLPFLVHLSPEEKRGLTRPGDKSRAFISKALEVANQNPDILPRMFNVEEMRKDVELSQSLQPIEMALTQLWEQFENTSTVINSEAYAAALAVYSLAKATGKSASLNDTLDELGKRFARKVPAKTSKEPAK
jgi:hypothetical protein